ncbi:translation initiation factor IF-2-like isoform X2 [Frankliniella occidentalis]|uniref:Translation initiation factor IF-2-like isoform X2 n=1 Tax=Frankliniella occidentalis TaxID=133901 RepID=A0A9C6U6E0_FRAOC|nr:translation initiation factor IF-2-like isoform X2 [Frankliniella occidentalis]
MAGPSWVHWLGVLLLLNSSAAQIFPFSNLRHIFKQEGKGGGGSKAPGSLGPPPTPEPSTTTTLEPPTTTGLAPYLAPYSLLDEDDGYREFQRPEYVVERPRPATRPTRVGHKAGAARPAQATLQPQATPVRTPPTKQKKRLPSHLVPVRIAAAESSAAAAAVILEGPGHRTPGNHRPGARPLSSPTTPTPSRAPKFKNHKPAPPGQAPAPARPVKYHNHRPGSLDGEESMTSLRYRKRPLGPIEQEVAQTGLQHQGQYPHAGDGERVEFQMHGLKGPSSYKFGYDTGKGQNRQFRYEERDHHGNVKGHYGYVDEQGKLQVVNYKADPHGGYKADVSKLHT